MMSRQAILRGEDLCKFFYLRERRSTFSLGSQTIVAKAVNEINLSVETGQTTSLVGESGSGKTTLGLLLARVFDSTSGTIWFEGRDVTRVKDGELRKLRRKVQMIFQDPGSSLNPRQTIESIVSLPLRIHGSFGRKEVRERVAKMLEAVHLPAELRTRYPGTLSGGQKQRVSIARALVFHPAVLILDEPTSALDVSVQGKILNLLLKIRKERGLTYVFITHDLGVAKSFSDKVAVMYFGRIVEIADTSTLFRNPIHPYTKALLSAIPIIKEEERRILPDEVVLDGDIPSLANPPRGCSFFSRCQEKEKTCRVSVCPDLMEVEKGHSVRCHNL